MHRSRIVLMALALACAPFVTSAQADFRSGAGAPPLLLSPDLTEPWVLQLQPQRRAMRPAVTNRPLPRQRQQVRPGTVRASAPAVATPRRTAQRAIDPRFLPTTVAWNGRQKPGTIVIDTGARYLYLIEKGGFARRYGVGRGVRNTCGPRERIWVGTLR